MEATQPSVAEVPQPSSGVARYGAGAQGSQQLELEGQTLLRGHFHKHELSLLTSTWDRQTCHW